MAAYGAFLFNSRTKECILSHPRRVNEDPPLEGLCGSLLTLEGLMLGSCGQMVSSFSTPQPPQPTLAVFSGKYGVNTALATISDDAMVVIGTRVLLLHLPAAMPLSVPLWIVEAAATRLLTMLSLLFGSPEKAMAGESLEERFTPLFDSLFGSLVLSEAAQLERFVSLFSLGVPWFNTSLSTRSQLDSALSSLEAPRRSLAGQLATDPRVALVVGACLYHRSILVATHLPPTLTSDVSLFCKVHGFLKRHFEAPSLVTWREVFCRQANTADRKPRTVVVVGRAEHLVCLVLALRSQPMGELDPYYVDEALAMLGRLTSEHTFDALDEEMKASGASLLDGALLEPSVVTHDVAGPGDFGLPHRRDRAGMEAEGAEAVRETFSRLTAGTRNHLYHYVSHSTLGELIVMPALKYTPMSDILCNFFAVAARIRLLLHPSFGSQPALPCGDGEAPPLADPKPFERHEQRAQQANEAAVHFHTDSGDGYWVVGRAIPGRGDFYVCHDDGAGQSVVEIAFKAGFGL